MKPKVIKSKCVVCESCIDICPVNAIIISKKSEKAFIKRNKCIDCGSCIGICPVDAIKRK